MNGAFSYVDTQKWLFHKDIIDCCVATRIAIIALLVNYSSRHWRTLKTRNRLDVWVSGTRSEMQFLEFNVYVHYTFFCLNPLIISQSNGMYKNKRNVNNVQEINVNLLLY